MPPESEQPMFLIISFTTGNKGECGNVMVFCLRFYLFLERGEERKKERERNIDVQENTDWLPLHISPNGNQASNPGMCPDQESKQWPLLWGTIPNSLSHASQGCLTDLGRSPHYLLFGCDHILSVLQEMFFSFNFSYLLILEKEKEKSICCSTYLCIHWLFLVRALTRSNPQYLLIRTML